MVEVVVAVLAVAADTVEVADQIEVTAQAVDVTVGVKVSGIGFFDALDVGVDDFVLTLDHANLYHLGNTHPGEVLICHGPHLIAFVAEVFKPHPDSVLDVRHHIGRPVIKDLETAHLHIPVMDIDPVVGHDVANGRNMCLVFELQLRDEHADSHVIAVGKARRDLRGHLGDIVHAAHEVL